MRVAHLSDLHLGYGSGQRAQDVLGVFEAAMASVAELGPDLVVVSGDVFDHPEVAAQPVVVFARAVAQLRSRLPQVTVAVAAGARDTPLDPERPGPLALLGEVASVRAACSSVLRFRILDGAANVVLAPHRAVADSRPLAVAPDPEAEWNVLVAYAAVASEAAHDSVVPLAGWDYVALGSNHVRTRVAERAHYAGSLERIGPDPWSEAAEDKGFMTFDAGSGKTAFRRVKARPAISLAPIDATGRGTATAARRLAEALAAVPGKIDGTLLRIPVKGLSPEGLAVLDREALEPVRHRATELRVAALRERPPKGPRTETAQGLADAQGLAVDAQGLTDAQGLLDARGLAAFVGSSGSAWNECVSALRRSSAPAQVVGGPGENSAGSRPLRTEEWAALWLGEGPAAAWVSAAAGLASSSPGGPGSWGVPGVAGTIGRKPAPEDFPQPATAAKGARAREGAKTTERAKTTEQTTATERAKAAEEHLRSLREEEAEVRGDLEAGIVAWVRERQDAETRLLLYRDRGRELRARMKQIDDSGPEGSCRSCGAPLGGRLESVAQAGREEWEGVVQDGRWWRQRMDQLEHKPAELKALESRALALSAEIAELAEQLERRRRGGRAGKASATGSGRTPEQAADPGTEALAEASDEVRALGEVRAQVHAEVVEITGGRLAGRFPAFFDAWVAGGQSASDDLSALEAAMRVAMAELAVEAGVKLDSVVLPDSLGRLRDTDVPRALDRLARLARRIPLVLVNAPERVVAAAPERFDLLLRLADSPDGGRIVRRQHSGLGAVRFQP